MSPLNECDVVCVEDGRDIGGRNGDALVTDGEGHDDLGAQVGGDSCAVVFMGSVGDKHIRALLHLCVQARHRDGGRGG